MHVVDAAPAPTSTPAKAPRSPGGALVAFDTHAERTPPTLGAANDGHSLILRAPPGARARPPAGVRGPAALHAGRPRAARRSRTPRQPVRYMPRLRMAHPAHLAARGVRAVGDRQQRDAWPAVPPPRPALRQRLRVVMGRVSALRCDVSFSRNRRRKWASSLVQNCPRPLCSVIVSQSQHRSE